MTTWAQTYPIDSIAISSAAAANAAPAGWEDVRDDSDIQFEPIELPPPQPREKSAFERALESFFEFLGDLFEPVANFFVGSWSVLQWVFLAAAIAFAIYVIVRTVGPIGKRKAELARRASEEPAWAPSEEQSLALLEEADRLAAQGEFDEATHLLLKRSVGHIAEARPDWVEPSSTARELAALPALSDAARSAFGTISERVERSLFALKSLDREDWETARSAYSDFALVRFDAKGSARKRRSAAA